MAYKNFQMVRGDTLAFGVELEDLDTDLSSAYFTARKGYNGEILFQKTLSNGISKVETGVYRVRVAPADTATAEAGSYYYDLQIGVNSDVYTLLIGTLELLPDVTY